MVKIRIEENPRVMKALGREREGTTRLPDPSFVVIDGEASCGRKEEAVKIKKPPTAAGAPLLSSPFLLAVSRRVYLPSHSFPREKRSQNRRQIPHPTSRQVRSNSVVYNIYRLACKSPQILRLMQHKALSALCKFHGSPTGRRWAVRF